MSPTALARSLPSSTARLWRALRWPTRVALVLLAVALPLLTWAFSRERPDAWPSRVSFDVPEKNYPLAFSPDGRTFLSTGEGGIIPWDMGNGLAKAPWASKRGIFVTSGTYSPDGRTFAAAVHLSQSSRFELIDTTTGLTKASLTTRHPLVFDLAFADDGRTLRAVLGDSRTFKEVATWDVATGQQSTSRPITAPIRQSTTAFSPDGRTLAFVHPGVTAVQLWDLEADATLGTLVDPARPGRLLGRGLDFSHDGRTLAVARSDGAIDLWDVPARKLLKTLPAHPRGSISDAIRFAPDGLTLASSGREVAPTSGLARLHDDVRRSLFGPSPSAAEAMVVVDVADGRRIARTSSSYYPMYTPDGRSLMTRRDDLRVRLRDLADSPR